MGEDMNSRADPVVQVTVYGGPRDPYRWIRERYTWRGDVLQVERTVQERGVIAEIAVVFPGVARG